MSLINAVKPILNSKVAKVVLEVSANPKAEDEVVVIAKPMVGPIAESAPEELKKLVGALSTYIKAVGTPDTIEAELYAVVNEQITHRDDWASRAATLEADIAQAAKKTATQKPAASKAATPSKPSKPSKDDESDLPAIGGDKPAPKNQESDKPDDNLSLEL